MTLPYIDSGAEISDCGTYRYSLYRRWDKSKPRMVWIMLNPSTADAKTDDPTIRVCMGRAHLMGYGGIRVINLFAYRATNPKELDTVDDPIGPDCNRALDRSHGLPSLGEMTIAAWGDGGLRKGYHRPRWREALDIVCGDYGTPLYCLGLTKAGQPRHPLRLPYSLEPTLWMNRDLFYKSTAEAMQ